MHQDVTGGDRVLCMIAKALLMQSGDFFLELNTSSCRVKIRFPHCIMVFNLQSVSVQSIIHCCMAVDRYWLFPPS